MYPACIQNMICSELCALWVPKAPGRPRIAGVQAGFRASGGGGMNKRNHARRDLEVEGGASVQLSNVGGNVRCALGSRSGGTGALGQL